jgi:hypothetical protein
MPVAAVAVAGLAIGGAIELGATVGAVGSATGLLVTGTVLRRCGRRGRAGSPHPGAGRSPAGSGPTPTRQRPTSRGGSFPKWASLSLARRGPTPCGSHDQKERTRRCFGPVNSSLVAQENRK